MTYPELNPPTATTSEEIDFDQASTIPIGDTSEEALVAARAHEKISRSCEDLGAKAYWRRQGGILRRLAALRASSEASRNPN